MTARLLLPLFIAVAASVAWGQSSIDESQETSHLYVDVVNGSDSNAGTQQRPFQTFAKGVATALAQSKNGIATKVTVLPGYYRESVTAGGSGSVPVTIEASVPGQSVISGGDVWRGWQVYANNPRIYTHAWPNQWGLCATLPGPLEQDILRRREMIFVNGLPLTQVLSLGEMNTGTFFVDESSSLVYIWPRVGVYIGSATVEVATRPTLLQLSNVHSWVIRGLVFQYANGCRVTTPAVWVTVTSTNVLFDNDRFVWNNATGLQLTSISNFTVSSCQAHHNGQAGIFSQYSTDSSWLSNQASYNNWRGAQGAFYTWDSGGIKFGEVHSASFAGLQTLYNMGPGIHLDTDIRDITIDSIVSNGNLNSGMLLEADPGPVTITDAKICGSNVQNAPYEGGVNLVDSSHVSLSSSILSGNGTSQIIVTGRDGGIAVKDFVTGDTTQIYNQNSSFLTNTIEALASQAVFKDGFLQQDWSTFESTLTSDNNVWWNPSSTSPFVVPVPAGNTTKTLVAWQALVSQDTHSSFTDPGGNPGALCQVAPDQPDYWLSTLTPSITVTHGNSASYTFTGTPLNYSNVISLAADVSSVPGGGASLSASSINALASSVLNVTTSSSTPAGTYPVTLVGTSGNTTHTVTVSLVVQ